MRQRALVITETGLNCLERHPLTKAEAALLWYAVRRLPPKGDFVSMAAWAEDLHMSHVHVVNSLKRLVQHGLLLRGSKDGTSYHLQLNPSHFSVL